MIHLPLDLSRHCIQTEVRRLHNRLLSQCLRSPAPDDPTEKKLELLQQALETWDFPALRAAHPELAGGREADVALVEGPDSRLTIVINGRSLPPL
ncbi:MAG: hypothetical protein ACOZBW_13815 [Thermodesulfobacteriota bacterium]